MQDVGMNQPAADQTPPGSPTPHTPARRRLSNYDKKWLAFIAAILIAMIVGAVLFWNDSPKKKDSNPNPTISSAAKATPAVQGVRLDPAKNYGNKYANGILPVGDGKYSAGSAKAG